MLFRPTDLAHVRSSSAHMLTIQFDTDALSDLEEKGFMLGVKLTLSRHLAIVQHNWELFQSLSCGERGTIDSADRWQPGFLLVRDTFSLGRWKYYRSSRLFDGLPLLETESGVDLLAGPGQTGGQEAEGEERIE
jgi:hypothetical protein